MYSFIKMFRHKQSMENGHRNNMDRCGRKIGQKGRGLLLRMVLQDRLSVRKAADALGVSHMTAYRALGEVRFAK